MLLVNDFVFDNAQHQELPVIKISSDEGSTEKIVNNIETKRDSGFFGTTDSGNNSYSVNFFSGVTVNVLARCIFYVYIVRGKVR